MHIIILLDVGLDSFDSHDQITDAQKLDLRWRHWKPGRNFEFSETGYINVEDIVTKLRRFHSICLGKYSLLVVCPSKKMHSTNFASYLPNLRRSKGSHEMPGCLVLKLYTNLKDALADFKCHNERPYRKTEVKKKTKMFIKIQEEKSIPIDQ